MSVEPERMPTRFEQAKWDKLVRRVDLLGDRVLVCRLLGANYGAAYLWGMERDIDVTPPADLENRFLAAEKKYNRLLSLVRKVQDNELAVRFRNGDIDIVDPTQNMGAFLLVAIGAVVLLGAVALAGYLWNELGDCEKELRIINGATDKAFCEEESSETCAEWKKYKIEARIDERKNWADKISTGLGTSIKTGAKWGLAVAIPLVVAAFIWRDQK
jgi:hypothetical protein